MDILLKQVNNAMRYLKVLKIIEMRSNYRIVTIFLLVVILNVILFTTPFYIIDDAYISFRYAYNLADSGQLVFNHGEYVEGITNLLWTLVLAIGFKIFHFPIETFAFILSFIFVIATTLRLWQLGPTLGTGYLAGFMGALLLILNKEFIFSATQGLEGALYSFFLVEIIYRYTKNQLSTALLCAVLLFATRPEGLLFGFLLIIILYAEGRSLKKTISASVIVLTGIGIITVFRLYYYGTLLPNSVIAKSFDPKLLLQLWVQSMIWEYIKGFVISAPYLVFIFFWALCWLIYNRLLRTKSDFILLFCVAGILISLMVTIRNGGDWMPNHRLLTQYSVLYSTSIIVLIGKKSIRPIVAIALLLWPLTQTIIGYPDHLGFRMNYAGGISEFWVETTKRLTGVINDSDIISAEALGYISYHLPHNKFHDPLGLTDPYLAKKGKLGITFGKSDASYSLGVIRPSVLIWHSTGHLKGVEQKLLKDYEIFCEAKCDDKWGAHIIMIRHDRIKMLGHAFKDWTKIKTEKLL